MADGRRTMSTGLLVEGQWVNVRVRAAVVAHRASIVARRTERLDDGRHSPVPSTASISGISRLQLLAVALGEAAGDDQARAAPIPLLLGHFEDRVDRFLLGVVDERAGVHDDHVGLRWRGRDLVARLLREAQHHLAVDEILGAPQRDKTDLHADALFDGRWSTLDARCRGSDESLPELECRNRKSNSSSSAHGYIRYSMRGYGMASRRCSSPQIHDTHALDAHAEAAVRDGAEAAQVEVPLERLLRQAVLLDPLQQQVVVGDALAAADDLAVALRREHVDAERDLRTLRIRLHVERLHRWTGSGARNRPSNSSDSAVSSGAPKSPPHSNGSPFAFRISTASSYEIRGNGDVTAFQLRRVALERLQLALPPLERAADHVHEQPLREIHHVVERRERHFGLDHPELGQVAARLGLLGAEGRPEGSTRARAPWRWLRCTAVRSASGRRSCPRSTARETASSCPRRRRA